MRKPNAPIPDSELQVLKLLWANECMTTREIAESIYGVADNSTVGTVSKLIKRLETKRCVKRDRSQYAHRFSAAVSQSDIAGWHLDSIAKNVADGSFAPFITHLVASKKLSKKDKEEIRRLLDEEQIDCWKPS